MTLTLIYYKPHPQSTAGGFKDLLQSEKWIELSETPRIT